MNTNPTQQTEAPLSWRGGVILSLVAAASLNLAYSLTACGFLIFVYLWCLWQLTRAKSARQAYYLGLLAGVLAFGPQLHCFWTLFGSAALALWYICGFWVGMFVLLGRACRIRFGKLSAVLLIPFIWTGLEYFRSELYYLRFSWLNAGYAFSDTLQWVPIKQLGVYGIGFVLMALVGVTSWFARKKQMIAGLVILAILGGLTTIPRSGPKPVPVSAVRIPVAGVQLEFPSELEVITNLDHLVGSHPEARLLALSEYSIDGPVPERIKVWCKQNERYLVIGGKAPAPNSQFYDTAYVVGPAGDIVFQQGKSVPVQFVKDGLPAKEQKLWDSPWGKIGICICYDLSYARVTDRLVQLGAQAIMVPTMDVEDWGRHQHELHARVAPVRAAEYGIPIFRVASSGISQLVNADGRTEATAPMPGQEAMIAGTLEMGKPGTLPLDRLLAPLSAGVTGVLIMRLWHLSLRERRASIAAKRELKRTF